MRRSFRPRHRAARQSAIASRAERYEAKQRQAEREEALRENALTVCAFDDMMMDLAVIASGLVAKGARTCTAKTFNHMVSCITRIRIEEKGIIAGDSGASPLKQDVYESA